jgi:hypothetical protein
VPDRTYRVAVADGVGAEREPNRQSRGSVGRPHWWVVLAVTLSLMAMIAAVRASHPDHRTAGSNAPPTRSGQVATPPGTRPGVGTGPTTSTTAPATTTTEEHGIPAAPPPSTTTTQPTVAGLVSDPAAASAPTASAPSTTQPSVEHTNLTYPGNLQYPDNIAVTLGFSTSPGAVTVTASWNTDDQLQLQVHCDGSPEPSAEGGPGLSVDAQSAGGDCSATLAEPSGVEASLSYEIEVSYDYATS